MRYFLFALLLNLALFAQEPAQVKGADAFLRVQYQDQEHSIYVGPTTRVGYDQNAKAVTATIYAAADPVVTFQFPGKQVGTFQIGEATSLSFTHETLKGTLIKGSLTITVLEKTALEGHFKGTLQSDSGKQPIEGRFLLPAYIR